MSQQSHAGESKALSCVSVAICNTGRDSRVQSGAINCYNYILLYSLHGWYLYVVYRGSEAFGNSCTRTMEPEDVTVGIIIGTSFVCFMSYL